MAIVKPDLSQQWASDGDKIAPSGAKIQAGWGPEIPPYQWENFIQNRQDEMLAYLNERGIPEWDNRTNYVGGGKSYVQGSDGKVYKSVAASGPASVVSNPTTDVTDTYWTVAFAEVGAFLTQAAGDTRYTQRSNNLSDLSNPTVARSNLGLGTAATANLTTSNTDGTVGRVLKVGDGGWMGQGGQLLTAYAYPTSITDVTNQTQVIRSQALDNGIAAYSSGIHFAASDTWGRLRVRYGSPGAWVQGGLTTTGAGWTSQVVLSDNLLQTTGSSTYFPMSQAAVTDQLATRAGTSTRVIAGTGLTGGGDLTADCTLSVAASHTPIGVGQTWQNVTASRSINTTYTNTTGRPIMVSVRSSVDDGYSQLTVGGVVLAISGSTVGTGDNRHTVCAIVPNGASYSYSGSAIALWAELL